MRVLLTNDDGIEAAGLRALRSALLEIEGIELDVIAPDSNRSATARSITTRNPLWVSEIRFDDGGLGYAIDGTPVDCVRMSDLGLIGERPDLIIAGINHGANLGDDVTYSGTVAAAFEAIILGRPGIAVSQQSRAREMDFRWGNDFDFSIAAALTARLARRVLEHGLPSGTLLNINCPGSAPTGIEVARLGKRRYDDSLELVESDQATGRRRYRIYGLASSFDDETGTDLAAFARGRVTVTPIHFDLTDHAGLTTVREWGLDEMLAEAAAPQ